MANDGFSSFGLSPRLLETLASLGYEEPTPIQREAIPPLLSGNDLLGEAATGTGKTAAFALPMLERIHADAGAGSDPRRARALVLVPTRELAMQVAEAVHKYGHAAFDTCVVPIYGGQAIQQQLRALKRSVDVVVATPGRAVDHIARGSLDLSEVRYVVLDEADEMLDMGFADDLDAILQALPAERQTALLSATIAPRVASIAKRYLKKPVRITIRSEHTAKGVAPRIRQTAYVVSRQQKLAALSRVLDMEDPASAIVFCRTRGEVDQLAESLTAHGYRAGALHGGLSQEERDRVMRRFRSADGSLDLLVATDVAARGLDIEDVSHVVNYDVPSSPDAYVHRIGRTGRAGRVGVAITFAEPRECRYLRNIEQVTKQKIRTESVPTIIDLRARKLDLTRAAIEEALAEGDLEEYRIVVETLASERDVIDVATAAVKLLHESRVRSSSTEEITSLEAPAARNEETRKREHGRSEPRHRRDVPPKPRRGTDDRAANDGAANTAIAHPASSAPSRRGRSTTRLFIGVGRLGGIRPKDIVGAIANEAGIPASGIGAIDIADGFSLVDVPESDAKAIVAALRGTTLRGKKVVVKIDKR
ncbi:MAG TPA: DEAD/DEAH box helicase [Gemmatimonadaceae bacterium]|nr:DEAD/DEAH box helicase [Gemmatimonadaceae bacterium]